MFPDVPTSTPHSHVPLSCPQAIPASSDRPCIPIPVSPDSPCVPVPSSLAFLSTLLSRVTVPSAPMDTHLLSNIQKLFSERIDIFSPVEFNKVRPWGHPHVPEVPELPTFLAITCLWCPRDPDIGVSRANDQD